QYPFLQTINDVKKPANMRVLLRGSPDSPGEEAPRRFLAILSSGERAPFTQGSGRLQLAEAIADAKNPLTPRVMVNRIWQRHFGQGIVRTPSNFGQLGDANKRRTVYGYVHRRKLDGVLALFDFPIPNNTSEQRLMTNVPLQRLFFMNGGLVAEQAKALAARLKGDDTARVQEAYRIL